MLKIDNIFLLSTFLKMSWYIALTDKDEIFPIYVTDCKIEIPKTSPNSSFTIDNDTWIITEKYPHIENNTIEWRERQYCQLVAYQKMTCLPDINRIIKERSTYIGKTLLINDKEYVLTTCKSNDWHAAYFGCYVNKEYKEIMFKDKQLFIAVGTEWVNMPVVWKESNEKN